MWETGHPFYTRTYGRKKERMRVSDNPCAMFVPVLSISLREKCREDFVEESELCADAEANALDAKLV